MKLGSLKGIGFPPSLEVNNTRAEPNIVAKNTPLPRLRAKLVTYSITIMKAFGLVCATINTKPKDTM